MAPAECEQFFNEYVVLMEALETHKNGRFACFPYWRPVDKPTVKGPQHAIARLERENIALKMRIDNDKKTARSQAAKLWAKNNTLEAEKAAAISEAAAIKVQLEEARWHEKAEEKEVEREGKNMGVESEGSSAAVTAAPKSIAIGTTVRIVKESSDHCNEVGPISKITRCYVWVRLPGKGEPRFRKTSVDVAAVASKEAADAP